MRFGYTSRIDRCVICTIWIILWLGVVLEMGVEIGETFLLTLLSKGYIIEI